MHLQTRQFDVGFEKLMQFLVKFEPIGRTNILHLLLEEVIDL